MTLMNKNEIEILQNYILKTAKSIAENSTLNIVKTGSIKSSEIGYYNAQLSTASDNSTVKAIALSDQQFLVGDIVYLVGAVAANGDEKNTTYYIFGRVKSIQEDFLNMSEWDRFRASYGTEWSSGKNDKGELTVYNYKEWKDDDAIVLDNSTLLEDIRNKTYFAITGHFTAQGFNAITKFDPIVSSYGLTISFVNDEDIVITDVNGNECSWILDTNFFTGQPFNLNNSFQKRIIHVNLSPETVWKKIKISALAKNLDTALANSNVMLFVSNLTLQAGFLTDLSSKMTVEVAAEDMKNYFYSTAVAADEVELQATVYYNQQILDSSNLRYYWFVKDDTITIGHDKWTEFGGENWRCLNESQEVEASDGIITTTIRDWTDNSSSILLTRAQNYCAYFENTFKCVVRYGTVNATSQDFLVYDYKKYDATVTLTPDSKLILNKDDKVTLAIESTPLNSSTNVKPRHTDYRWTFTYVNGKDTVNDTVYGSAIMYLKNSGNESVFEEGKNWKDENVDIYSVYEIQGHPATIDCSCEVLFDFEEGDGEEIVRKTAIETISNKISEESEVEQINEYKYYIADTSFLSFERVLTEEKGYDEAGNEIILNERKWNGDWKLAEWDEQQWINVNLNTLPAGISPFDYLLSDTQKGVPLGDNQYLFYTSRTVWIENSTTLKETNWDYPSILKYSLAAGSPSLHGAAVAELNAFNSLTKGGSADGVFYAQGEYLLTEDTEWNDTKTYYIKNIAINDTITYSKINKQWTNSGEFDLYTTYYIRQVYQKVASPVQENLKSYYELSGSYYVTTSDTEINEEKTYYIKLDNSTPIYIQYEVEEDSKPQAGQTYYIYESGKYVPELYQTYAASGYGNNPSESATPIYEQISDDQKLYINATYIQTGTLRVGERGKEKFFATIANEDSAVQIAGFTVDENSLSSGNKNEGKYVYLGTDGLQIGDAVSVEIAENGQANGVFKGSFIFSSGDSIDEVIEDIALRQLKVVYSNSEDIPNESPKGPEETGNIGENKLWHETLQEDDIWMCQKVATDIYDNSDGAWGNIVQIQGLDGEIGMTGPGVKKQEEQYSRSSSSIATDDTEAWYSKEVFFARESLWADPEDVKDYPYVWKRIKTIYTNEMEEYSTPLLLSNLDAATFAATAQIEDQEGKDPSVIVAEWCKKMGRTIIDGSTIVSGSITADQIAANTITAAQIAADTITSKQINTKELFAAQATIGNWQIGTNSLYSGSGASYVGLASSGAYRIWAGDLTASKAPFWVSENGELYSSNGTIGGWIIGTDCLMSQNENVTLFSSKEETEYAITAGAPTEINFLISSPDEIIIYYHSWDYTDPKQSDLWYGNDFPTTEMVWEIGKDADGCYISNTYEEADTDIYYYKGRKQYDGTTYDYWENEHPFGTSGIYTNIITKKQHPFALYNDGSLYASKATIEGKITAQEGDIGGWNIDTDALTTTGFSIYSANANSDNILEAMYINDYETDDVSVKGGYSFAVTKDGGLITNGKNTIINQWNFRQYAIVDKPSFRVRDPFAEVGHAKLTNMELVLDYPILSYNFFNENQLETIAFSQDRIYGTNRSDEANHIDILTFRWWDALKAIHKSLGIKTGTVTISSGKDTTWKYELAFISTVPYHIVTSSMPYADEGRIGPLETATLQTATYFNIINQKYYYYVGRRGSNTSSYDVDIMWIAMPSSSSYIDYDTGNDNFY